MSLLSDNAHTLINTGLVAPVNLAASFAKDYEGKRGIRPFIGPLGAYLSYRAGRDMDKGELSEMDAALNAGFLANNISAMVEPKMSGILNKPMQGLGMTKGFGHIDDLTRRRAFMGLGTLGLGLPLYFYFRQGMKKQPEGEAVDNNP